MSTSTTRLGLVKADPPEFVDVVAHINNAFDKVDAAISSTVCTSSTRPGSPYVGQLIFETDTGCLRVWDGTRWKSQANKVQKNDVTASEATTSATFTALTTPGPAVTVPLLNEQQCTVVVSAYMKAASGIALTSWAVSGAATVAANDNDAASSNDATSKTLTREGLYVATADGNFTFTQQYRSAGGGSCTFDSRRIIAKPLYYLSLIHISEPTRLLSISYAVFCLKKK